MKDSGKQYIGLDVHKHYLIALGVDADLNVVLPARQVELRYLEAWMKKSLTKQDEVVLEMTTNTWQRYDEIVQYAGLGTCVHNSGMTSRSGKTLAPGASAGVTKTGRRDLRTVMIEAANVAANNHPH